jgi:photosystem II stability/assembly factor-like uncharacterized protein
MDRTSTSRCAFVRTFLLFAVSLGAGGAVGLAGGGPGPLTAQEADANTVYDPALFEGLEYRLAGPFRGGRSTTVTGVPGQPHTFLMGTTGGGVWKTDDAGMHWDNITDGFFGGSIGAVAVADSDPNVIFAGQGSVDIRGNTSTGRGVWKSTDAGKTWSFSGLPEAGQIGRIRIHPQDPELVYVAALGHPFGKNPERGIFRSKDGGDSWEHVLAVNDSTGASDLAMNPGNPRILYAGMWRGERKPWAVISGGLEGGVYRSMDGGDTWEKVWRDLPQGLVGKVGVTVSAANPDRVWAMIQAEPDGGVWRSDDAGATWKRVNGQNKLRQRAFYYTHVVADPTDENTVWGLNVELHKSVDGGQSFESVAVPHGDIHDLWINPEDNRIMVVGNDGGGQVTLNGGRTWSTYLNQPTAEFYDVIVDNEFPYRLYAGQQDNTAISVPAWLEANTLNEREGWENIGGCETGPVALDPDDPTIVYAGCYSGIIDRWDRATQQRRWVTVYPQEQSGDAAYNLKYRFQWVAPMVVDPHDSDVVYHGSQYVHRSTDGGMSWETISPDLTTNDRATQDYAGGPIDYDITGVEVFNTVFSLAVSSHARGEIWAGTDDGRVQLTRDGGETWTDVTPPGTPEYGTVDEIDLSVHQPGRAFVAVQRYRMDDWAPYVFRTEDFGRTWQRLTNGSNGIPADHPVRTVREDPERQGLLYAGTEFGMFVSLDDGGHWQPLQLNLPITPITGMRVAHDDLILSTQGRSFWILDDVTPLRQLTPDVAAASLHLFAPRPATRANMGGVEDEGESRPEARPGPALFHYFVDQEPADPVRLAVLDETGSVLIEAVSDSATADAEGIDRIPPEFLEAGMHRVPWELQTAGPRTLDGAEISGYDGGVKVAPGLYTVRLSVGDRSRSQPLQVLADPRLPDVTQADYEAQFRLAVAIRDTLTRIYDGLRAAQTVTQQLDAISERIGAAEYPAQIRELADTVAAKLKRVERELRQTKNQSGQDMLRYPPKLDTQFLTLYSYVTGHDNYSFGGPEGRPTEGAVQRFEDLNREWSALRDRLRVVLAEDVRAFNEMLARNGVPGVITPGSTEGPIP